MDHPDYLRDIINEAYRWDVYFDHADGVARADVHCDHNVTTGLSTDASYTLVIDDFSHLHPDLPTAIKDLAEHTSFLRGSAVRIACMYLTTPRLTVPRHALHFPSDKEQAPHYTLKITSTSRMDARAGLLINCMMYGLRVTDTGLQYASSAYTTALALKAEWLDESLPGWEERCMLSEALGLDQLSMADHVFYDRFVVQPENLAANIPSDMISACTD